jgi:hypothetical protein
LPRRNTRGRCVVPLAALGCCVALLSSCGLSRLEHVALTKDDRLTFTAPPARGLVSALPVQVGWTFRGLAPSGLNGRSSRENGVFAVFVDRAPVSVGESLGSVAKGDQRCRRTPGCPDADYLEGKGIYVTTDDHLDVSFLPPADKGIGDEQHTVTVVLLDGTGVRRTESAWYRTFRTPRRQ